LLKRHIQGKTNVPCQRLGKAQERVVHGQRRPGRNRASTQRLAGIADQQSRTATLLNPQPLPPGTPAERTAKAKMMWVEWLETPAAAVAGEVLAVPFHLPLWFVPILVHVGHVEHTPAQVKTRFDGVRQPAALAVPDNDTVYHDLDLVFAAMVDCG